MSKTGLGVLVVGGGVGGLGSALALARADTARAERVLRTSLAGAVQLARNAPFEVDAIEALRLALETLDGLERVLLAQGRDGDVDWHGARKRRSDRKHHCPRSRLLTCYGPRFATGPTEAPDVAPDEDAGANVFLQHYTPAVRAALPAVHVGEGSPILAALRGAGFAFLTDANTQRELERQRADGTQPRLTEEIDYRQRYGVSFKVVDPDRLLAGAGA